MSGIAVTSLTAACANNTTVPSAPSAFHAEVADPAGDAVVAAGVSTSPDLIHATVDVAGGNVTFGIQFAPGALDPQTTRVTIELDTDQNLSTGIAGAGPMGIDYIVDMWAPQTPGTLVQQAAPTACAAGGACYVTVGTALLNVGSDGATTTVPLGMIGNASGRLNYRILAYGLPQQTTPTITADVMPNISLPPAHVP
jgi:hypothetical protein